MSREVFNHWRCDWCGEITQTKYAAPVSHPTIQGGLMEFQQQLPPQWALVEREQLCTDCATRYREVRNEQRRLNENRTPVAAS